METEDPDIVQQLRIMIQYTNPVAGSICSKGADEIERLRALLWEHYDPDDRYLHEPAGEVPKGKTRRL